MERIKQALEKARQERQIRQGGDAAPRPVVPRPPEPGTAGEVVSPTVSLDEAVLRNNRIIAGLAPGPFTEAYNLLRTRILQTFREHNWNTLGITSPGPSAGSTLTAINLAIGIAREVDYTVLLVDANLRGAKLTEADFSRANLSHVDLRDANTEAATFGGAKLDQARFDPQARPVALEATG